jgi:excisionase family DNA binding protein
MNASSKRKPRSPTPKLPFEQRLTLDITETARKLGLGRNTVYSLIRAKRLDCKKFGSRSAITTDSIRALLSAEAV